MRAAKSKFADFFKFFGIELIQIFLIGSNVSIFEIAKSTKSLHPNAKCIQKYICIIIFMKTNIFFVIGIENCFDKNWSN